jgi:tetratricopeptide (TPR) repeat protein
MLHIRTGLSITLGPKRHLRVHIWALLLFALLGSLALPGVCLQVAPADYPMSGEVQRLYQSGIEQVKAGHIGEAIEAFKKGLEIAPQDSALLDATGAAYSMRGELETARGYFIESLKADPGFVPAKQNLGITLFSLGRYEESEDQFKSIQGQAGRAHTVANLFLGMIAEKRTDCKAAMALLSDADSLLYQYPDAVLSFAHCEYQTGNPQRATQVLAAFERIEGLSPSQYQQAADLYTQLGQNQQARSALNKAKSEKQLSASIGKKRLELLEKTGRLNEAQSLLENQAGSAPTGDVLLDLARIAKERGDFAVAMKSLQRASEIEPNREDSYLEFSTICADHGNDSLALETAEIGLSHVPDSYRLTVQKGVVLEKLGHLEDAESALRKAIGMRKDNSIALLSLAVTLAHGGRADESEQILDRAIQQFPDNYYMYYFQGKLLQQFAANATGKSELRESAKRSLQQSIRINPSYADSYYQLSNLYLESNPKLAEQTLQKCLKLDPNHIPAEYSLARLYIRTGRKAEGQSLLARFKTQQRSEELQQQKQLRIDVAQN